MSETFLTSFSCKAASHYLFSWENMDAVMKSFNHPEFSNKSEDIDFGPSSFFERLNKIVDHDYSIPSLFAKILIFPFITLICYLMLSIKTFFSQLKSRLTLRGQSVA
jgi:hypothetical protein